MKKKLYRLIAWIVIFFGIRQSIKSYIKSRINCGYTSLDGSPLECEKCSSHVFRTGKHYSEEGVGTTEYQLLCFNCNHEVGYWAYGSWTI